MIGYKGFDKDFKCHGFQYEVGKTYRHKGAIDLCAAGFHFCRDPFGVFNFYDPCCSRFAEIEATGDIDSDNFGKSCTNEIRIVRELTLAEMIQAATHGEDKSFEDNNASVAVDKEKDFAINTGRYGKAIALEDSDIAVVTGQWSTAASTGDCGAAVSAGHGSVALTTGKFGVAVGSSNSAKVRCLGNYSIAVNTGNYTGCDSFGDESVAVNIGDHSVTINEGDNSIAVNSGNKSHVTSYGKRSVAISTGRDSFSASLGQMSIAIAAGDHNRASGSLGSWLVLTEWKLCNLVNVQAVNVDGINIKADTFYMLKDGEVIADETSH